VHLLSILLLALMALVWVLYGVRDSKQLRQRCLALGKLVLMTAVCFIGIHLVNSIPAQVQATPPSLTK